MELTEREDPYQKKYFALRKRCEQVQQSNEKLVNRLQHVKKMVKQYKKERRFLMRKLDENGDGYKQADVPYMWEESQLYGLLVPPPPPMPEIKEEPNIAGYPVTYPSTPTGPPTKPPKAKKIKTEKDKDSSAPKRPANAFLMFCQHLRPTVQEEYFKEHSQEITNQELTKRLAIMWNNLTPNKKQVYYELYGQQRELYKQEVGQQLSSHGDASSSTSSLLADPSGLL